MGGCCAKPLVDAAPAEAADDATGGLAEMYEVKHLLGSGSAGDTWLCRDRASGELLAVKLMKRPIPQVMGTNIVREVKIGAQLGKGHLNIVKPRDLILTRTHLGIVMEYVAGGNMADYILKTILLKFGSFDTRDGLVMEEPEARYFFTQVIDAVDYCHRNKVAHRDLKMDNTLLDDDDPPRIKLCDFGFAKWWTQEPQMCTITGTPDYMSPQLLGAKAHNKAQALYDGTKADIWAAGVMLCVMLIGRFPFEGIEMSNATNLEEVSAHVWRQQNTARWYDNPLIAQDCSMLSPECMDLLNKMFDLDEGRRITIPGIRQHPWFGQPLPQPYAHAYTQLEEAQAKIDQQVASGAYVCKDRDSALHRMIALSATTYSPEQDALLQPAGGDDGPHPHSPASMLNKISLNSIKPYQYESDFPAMSTITSMFDGMNGDEPEVDSGPAGSTPAGSTPQPSQHAAAAAVQQADGQQQLSPPSPQQQQQVEQQQQQQQQSNWAQQAAADDGQQQQQGQQHAKQQHLPPLQQQQPPPDGRPYSQQDQQQQHNHSSNSSSGPHHNSTAAPAGSTQGLSAAATAAAAMASGSGKQPPPAAGIGEISVG